MKKIISLVLVVAMIATLGLAYAAIPEPGTGTLTITNAAKGVEYKIWKVLSAEVGEKQEGQEQPVIYTDTPIPAPLDTVLERVDTATSKNVLQYIDGKGASDLKTALDGWYENHKTDTPTAKATCNGNSIQFNNLEFGYYIIKGFGDNLMMVSVSPNGTIYEKNTIVPSPSKTVGDLDYCIGDTIPYTVTFNAPNYHGTGENAPIVIRYEVSDTLPEFLSNARVTEITIDGNTFTGDALNETNFPGITTFATGKTFTIPWVNGTAPNYTSKYSEGSAITIKYSAELTSIVNIGAANTNTVSIQPVDYTPTGEEPWERPFVAEEIVKTYAIALKKTDGHDHVLPGAKFKIAGLQTTPTVSGQVGSYTVVSTSAAAADETEMEVGADGMLYIYGLDDDITLTVTETVAPTGYNLLKDPFDITPVQLTEKVYKTSGTIYYDSKGNVTSVEVDPTKTETKTINDINKLPATAVREVVNNQGTELPETGGIGTTIFYILGGLLVVGAAVILVARRKAQD